MPPTRLRPGSRLNTIGCPRRAARAPAAGDEHPRHGRRRSVRGGSRRVPRRRARGARLDAGAPGSDGTIPRDVKITHVAAGSRHSALGPRARVTPVGLVRPTRARTCEDASDPKPAAALGACLRAPSRRAPRTRRCSCPRGVYAFGSNQDGQLGVPPSACALGAATATPAGGVFVGTTRDAGRARRALAVHVGLRALGARHTACVTRLATWSPGAGTHGQLGVRTARRARRRREPPRRTSLGKVKKRGRAGGYIPSSPMRRRYGVVES